MSEERTSERVVPLELTEFRKASSRDYWNVFAATDQGRLVLEDLTARFHDGALFVRGAQDDTYMNLGRRDVVSFILTMIRQAKAGRP